MNSGRFYCLWMSNCFLRHKEYININNVSGFHYNRFEKTEVFNQYHVYGFSDDFFVNKIYLK